MTLRPLADRRNPRAIDESTDAYDTIDWLVAHLPRNSGKVGVLGYSYRGWLAAMAAIHPHPALKAVCPQAPVADVWLGDDFFHQGAFRPTQGVLYAGYIEGDGVSLPEGDPYEVYRRYPTLDSLAAAAGVAALPSWKSFREHPAYDEYWRARALQRALTHATVPTLVVGGWWDEEDILGAQLLYRTLERTDSARQNRLVLGPWSHGAWVRSTGDSLGPIALGSSTSVYYRARIERPWFAYYLHGTGDGRFPEAWLYETGADRWRTADAWPGPSRAPTRLYLHTDGKLAFIPPDRFGGVRRLCVRSQDAGPERAAGQRRGQLAARRPALPGRTPRRAHLALGAPGRRPDHRGRRRGADLRLHHRDRRRLGREADRCLPRLRRRWTGIWQGISSW